MSGVLWHTRHESCLSNNFSVLKIPKILRLFQLQDISGAGYLILFKKNVEYIFGLLLMWLYYPCLADFCWREFPTRITHEHFQMPKILWGISYKTTHRTFVFCVPTTNPPHFDPTFVPKPKELLPVDPSALRATRLWHLPRRAGGWRCHDSSSVAATENAHDSLPDAKGSHHHLSGAAMAFCCWVNTTLTWWQFSLLLIGSYYSWRALKTTLLTWAGFRDVSIPEKVWLEH